MNLKGSPLVLVFARLLLLTSCGASSSSLPKGAQAPDFTLEQLDGAGKLTLSEVNKDAPVLLVFWATWCPSCVDEIPQLNELFQAKANTGVRTNLEINDFI